MPASEKVGSYETLSGIATESAPRNSFTSHGTPENPETQAARRSLYALLTGRLCSLSGTVVYSVAVAWLVLELGGGALHLGLLAAAALIPNLVFSLAGGIVADRYSRRQVAQKGALIRGLIIAAIPLLSLVTDIEIWYLFVQTLALGLVRSFTEPAHNAIIAELAPRTAADTTASTGRTNALWQGASQVGALAGTASGGFIIALLGSYQAFWCGTLGCFVAAIMLQVVRIPLNDSSRTATATAGRNARAELGEAWSLLASNKSLQLVAFLGSLPIAFMQALNVLGAPYIKDILSGDVVDYGMFTAAWALGSFIAAIVCLRFVGGVDNIRWHFAVNIVLAILAGLFVIRESLVVVLVVSVPLGFAAAFANIIYPAYVQAHTASALVGRVLGMMQFTTTALGLVFAVAIGFCTTFIPITAALGSWVILFGIGALLLARPALSRSATSSTKGATHVD